MMINRSKKQLNPVPLFGSIDSRTQPENQSEDLVEVGFISDAYGLQGAVKVVAHAGTLSESVLLKAKRWYLQKATQRVEVDVVKIRDQGVHAVAYFSQAKDRDQALYFKGFQVFVSRQQFPALQTDEFYWVDLIGLEVVNLSGVCLGKIVKMIETGAHSVMCIHASLDESHTTKEHLIPFVDVYVKTVSLQEKRVVVDWEMDY